MHDTTPTPWQLLDTRALASQLAQNPHLSDIGRAVVFSDTVRSIGMQYTPTISRSKKKQVRS